MTRDEAGQLAYEGFHRQRGVVMVEWSKLDDDTKADWCAAGQAVMDACVANKRRGPVVHYRHAFWYMNACGLGTAANATSKKESVTCKSCLHFLKRDAEIPGDSR